MRGRVKATTGTSTVLEGVAALYAYDHYSAARGVPPPSPQAPLPSGQAAAEAATTTAEWFKANAWRKGNGTLLDNWNITAQRWAPAAAQFNDEIDGVPGSCEIKKPPLQSARGSGSIYGSIYLVRFLFLFIWF